MFCLMSFEVQIALKIKMYCLWTAKSVGITHFLLKSYKTTRTMRVVITDFVVATPFCIKENHRHHRNVIKLSLLVMPKSSSHWRGNLNVQLII